MEQPQLSLKRLSFTGILHHVGTLSLLARSTLLTLGLLTAVTAVTTLARPSTQGSSADPFAVYAAIFPGQRADSQSMHQSGFLCQIDTFPAPADVAERCVYAPMTGTLSAINVVLWDGIVERLDFTLRQGAFSIGDLTLLWGSPQLQTTGQWVSLNWPERHINGSSWSEGGHFSYFQSVRQLSFGSVKK
jgi:hypothetical protein